MPFVPDSSSNVSGSFVPDETFSPEKTVSNIIPDIKEMVRNTGANAQQFAPLMGGDAATVMPGLIKQGIQMLANPKATVENIARPVLHPVDYFQEHPVQQSLNALGAAGLAAKGAGAALNAVPLTENVVPSVGRVMNNQTLKSFGGTMGQIKQMEEGRGGREALDTAAQFARDNGLTDVLTTSLGREKTLKSLLDTSGKNLGALRDQAGPASPDIVNQIVQNPAIDKYLGQGSASRELGGVEKALADIQEVGGKSPTHASLAEAATYINKNAAGNKLYQPVNAETEIANILSHENDSGIAQALGSDKAKQYVAALNQQRQLHPLEHLAKRGELRETAGRGGIGLQMIQRLADEFGYRLTAKGAEAVHNALTGNGPNIAQPAIANSIAGTPRPAQPPILDLIEQLKQKFNQGRR